MLLPIRFARLLRHAVLLMVCASAGVRPGMAQEAVSATSGSPEAIARIRAQFAQIEREAPGYPQTAHDVYDFSLEGGVLTGFYRGAARRRGRSAFPPGLAICGRRAQIGWLTERQTAEQEMERDAGPIDDA
jgi:hypothetical protein